MSNIQDHIQMIERYLDLLKRDYASGDPFYVAATAANISQEAEELHRVAMQLWEVIRD